MPLLKDGELIITAHASKKSKINLKLFQAHTSVLVPLLAIPLLPFWTTVKFAFMAIAVLIVLERAGYTPSAALKRIRTKLAGRHRFSRTRHAKQRRIKNN